MLLLTTTVEDFLSKLKEFDQDDRYMAISDLLGMLKEPELEFEHDQLQNDICAALLERLDKDSSNDVQTITITCLAQLLQRCAPPLVAHVADQLASRILKSQSKIKDVYSIGLKTIIASIPDGAGNILSSGLIENVVTGIMQEEEDIKIEFLDILPKLLSRFGSCLLEHVSTIKQIAFNQLRLQQNHVSKRVSRVFFQLAPYLTPELLQSLINTLLQAIEEHAALSNDGDVDGSDSSDSSDSDEDSDDSENEENSAVPPSSPYIQSLNAVAESVAARLGSSTERIVGVMLRSIGSKRNRKMGSKAYIELREQCFATIRACIGAGHPLQPSLLNRALEASLSFLNYDPNFIDDSDSESESDDEDDEENFMDEDDEMNQYDVEYEDTDDTSWKVRQSCLNLLQSFVGAADTSVTSSDSGSSDQTATSSSSTAEAAHESSVAPSNTTQHLTNGLATVYLDASAYDRCLKAVVGRFKERESVVQLTVFECIGAFVQYATSSVGDESRAGIHSASLAIVPDVVKATLKYLQTQCQAVCFSRHQTICSFVVERCRECLMLCWFWLSADRD